MMKLSGWIVVDGYCATRIIEGGDFKNVADRVAFIEKTPRVRIAPHSTEDWINWESGPKGDGGCLEADGETIYGFYQPSRDWCDEKLVEMGYELQKGIDMRLGTVSFSRSYVVDLDNPDQVENAKEAVYDDVMETSKWGTVSTSIKIKTESELLEDAVIRESHIPDFIAKDEDDEGE